MVDDELTYKDFKTGLTFKEVRQILQIEADSKYEKGEYMFITRATVLGRWFQIKKQMYDMYLQNVAYFQMAEDSKRKNTPDFIHKEY
jgi:hypothetical protein